MSDKVLARTLPRTVSAQKDENGRTFAAHSERAAHIAIEVELRRLVRACGEAYGFTQAEHGEALALALANPDEALASYRLTYARLKAAGEIPLNRKD